MDSIRIDSWCTPTMIAPPGEILIVDQPSPLDQNTDPSVGTSVKLSTLLEARCATSGSAHLARVSVAERSGSSSPTFRSLTGSRRPQVAGTRQTAFRDGPCREPAGPGGAGPVITSGGANADRASGLIASFVVTWSVSSGTLAQVPLTRHRAWTAVDPSGADRPPPGRFRVQGSRSERGS